MALSIAISNSFNSEVLTYDALNPSDGGPKSFSSIPPGSVFTCAVINDTPNFHFEYSDENGYYGEIINGTTINRNDHPTGFTVNVVGDL